MTTGIVLAMVAAAAMHAGLCCEDGSGGCGGDGGERGGVAVQPTVAVTPGTYESHRVLHRGTVRFSVPWYLPSIMTSYNTSALQQHTVVVSTCILAAGVLTAGYPGGIRWDRTVPPPMRVPQTTPYRVAAAVVVVVAG